MNYQVLLFYKFAAVDNPQVFRDEHHALCQNLNLKGRVYIAKEGINGTVGGTIAALEDYKSYLRSKPGFSDIEFKIDESQIVPFAKLKTKVRPYILNMGFKPEEDVNPAQKTGRHLSPKEWREVLESHEDYVLLDIRNRYESVIGHFKGAVCPDLETFTEFPDWADKELAKYKDKKVLMYCTGGIRCEKFSSLLLEKGFQDINQLHGGILNYAKEEQGEHFEGRCFVFDDRLVVDVSQNPETLASCLHCGAKEDKYVNCANMECNKLFIVCDLCAAQHEATCSQNCFESTSKRPFDPQNFRVPFRKKGVVFPELGRRQFKKTA